ncbi:hypothetical protein BBJ29_004059 [Phytophthora kernoviae]|uniref:Uncharacterized protein n=1 Tax=Phytophthora kernoviae TaxID=325452 RepID=A0A421G0C9_9STRA|nr:hypothetical protein BBJ29_004059 [Phytophthora kernoviae]
MAWAESEETSSPSAPMESSEAAKELKSKPKEVILGICGGVGPAAGLLLHQLILENTDSAGEDQGHLNVSHFSRSEDMTDRTEYLAYVTNSSADATDSDSDSASSGCEGPCDTSRIVTQAGKPVENPVENPACGMARTFAMMHAAATAGRTRLVVGVPCNTFHAQPIWDEFMLRTGSASNVHHVHMLEETMVFIATKLPMCTRVGLMSTTGTRQSRVYHDLLEPRGYTVVERQPCHHGVKPTSTAMLYSCASKVLKSSS